MQTIQKSNLENKLLRQQVKVLLRNNEKVKSSASANYGSSQIDKSLASEPTNSYEVNNLPMSGESETAVIDVNDKTVTGKVCKKPNVINIISDSIPTYVSSSHIQQICGVKPVIQKLAPTVNEAVDYIQDKADPDAVTVIHTGTRNLKKDSTMTIIRRLQRLEANIKHKGIKIIQYCP